MARMEREPTVAATRERRMMMSYEHHLQIVDAIYEASLDVSRWDGVVSDIIHGLGGVSGALLLSEWACDESST